MVKKKIVERNRRINKDYVDRYNEIELIQPLTHGTHLKQIYNKEGNRWAVTYSSTSVYHVCPYDGVFRNCRDCGALEEDFDVKFCTKKLQHISSAALVERIVDCMAAGLEVVFVD